ncbi:hypothetical protein [Micromonospora endolithica]|uniref:Uncharacterized protein n=1 Tax=Micromonospora endolithica TaxID=230091 RepID=A0A3A9YX11_9ACTN|nr:hypothetical protein [Micromonospora endolithica]RKN40563.1 hypothetical protein D7223_25815 [Micromonospora endolithica]TWJ21639.1 hypothetical protein JD76_01749 [Micromonospora endolithica]
MRNVVVDAVRDNAGWCELICRTHGLVGVTDGDAWSVPRRSPTWYPDAVTLRPGVDPGALLRRIDAGPGASVKDSFADLDLTGYGFQVLFTARWIHRPAAPAPAAPAPAAPDPAAPDPTLSPVRSPDALTGWAEAHGGDALFRPALLADPRVTVLAGYDASGVTAGAILHAGGPVVGVSNVFVRTGPADAVWRALPATDPLVGYESGDDLAAARRAGFHPTGPLRVWLHR